MTQDEKDFRAWCELNHPGLQLVKRPGGKYLGMEIRHLWHHRTSSEEVWSAWLNSKEMAKEVQRQITNCRCSVKPIDATKKFIEPVKKVGEIVEVDLGGYKAVGVVTEVQEGGMYLTYKVLLDPEVRPIYGIFEPHKVTKWVEL